MLAAASGTDDVPYLYYLNADQLAAEAGQSLLTLACQAQAFQTRLLKEAVDLLTPLSGIDARVDYQRSALLHGCYLAEAHLRRRDLEASVEVTRVALTRLAEVRSTRCIVLLTGLRRAFARRRRAAAVAAFLPELDEAAQDVNACDTLDRMAVRTAASTSSATRAAHHAPDLVLAVRSYHDEDSVELVASLHAEQLLTYGYADPVEAAEADYAPFQAPALGVRAGGGPAAADVAGRGDAVRRRRRRRRLPVPAAGDRPGVRRRVRGVLAVVVAGHRSSRRSSRPRRLPDFPVTGSPRRRQQTAAGRRAVLPAPAVHRAAPRTMNPLVTAVVAAYQLGGQPVHGLRGPHARSVGGPRAAAPRCPGRWPALRRRRSSVRTVHR